MSVHFEPMLGFSKDIGKGYGPKEGGHEIPFAAIVFAPG